MSEETVSHEGIVTQINEDEIQVKIIQESACASCHAKGACTVVDQAEKYLTVPRPSDREIHLFQKVNVVMKVGQGNAAAVFAYLIPIVVLLAVLFLCLGLGLSEGLSALLGIAALIPYYTILYLKRDKLKKRFDCHIE